MFDFPPPMTEPNREKTCETGENKSLRFASCAMPGWRPFQQDAHNCILDYNNGPEVNFFAVYDGHVSAKVAMYSALKLPDYLKQRNVLLLDNNSMEEELKNAFVDFDATLREEETVDKMYAIPDLSIPTGSILVDLGETWMGETADEEAVAQGDEEEKVQEEAKEEFDEQQNLDPEVFPPDEFGGIREGHLTGSTACVALVFKERIVVANAGDSRAVLCRAGQALDLSSDHKSKLEGERKRIEAAGGKVENGRLNGGIHRSRGFGHHCYKQRQDLPPSEQMLTALPDVTTTPRDWAQDEFLVIASGDIWSRMSSQQLCDFVAQRIGQNELQQIVKEICEHCCSNELVLLDGYNFGPGCENETVILIDLKKDQRPAISSSSSSMKKVEEKRSCRLCHGTDEDEDAKMGGIGQEWVQPCKCSGTLKWVHRGCFEEWHAQAPYQQRTQCSMCSYFYRFAPRLKPRWYTQFDMTFQILAPLATSKLVYDLASLDLHAIFTSFTICCLVMAMEYRQQLQLLELHKVRLQMRELHGQIFWHVTGGQQQQDNGLLASSSNQSVFEESIQNAI